MGYTGSVDLISGIRPKNNGTFPLVDAKDVRVDDNTRLDAALTNVSQTVRFDTAQTLTDAQKQQARENIGVGEVDATLSVEGMAADAKKTGDEITALKSGLNELDDVVPSEETVINLSNSLEWNDDKFINVITGNVMNYPNYSYAVAGEVKRGDLLYCSGLRGIGQSRAITLIENSGIIENQCTVLAFNPSDPGYFTGSYEVPFDGIVVVETHSDTKQNVVVRRTTKIRKNIATQDQLEILNGSINTLNDYIDYVSPLVNLIDFNDLTPGYINGTGGINAPSSSNMEKTSQIIPVKLNHIYRFESEISESIGVAWVAVGVYDSNGKFLGRPSAQGTSNNGMSVATMTLKPIDNTSFSTASYMRVSWRSFGLENVVVNDITYDGKNILTIINNSIIGKNNLYHVSGAEIDVTKKGYDVTKFPFSPIQASGKNAQGMAIANGTIFQGFGNGTIDLYDIEDGTLINSFNSNAGHCGSLSFSDEYPSGNNDFPYLYVASFNENKTFVFNVTSSSMVLEKTYTLPNTSAGYCQETCFDKTSNTLWCVGHELNSYENGGHLIFTQWDLSRVTEENGLITPTLIKSFDVPWIDYLQCIQSLNGQLFVVFGGAGSATNLLTKIYVLDAGNNAIKSLLSDFPNTVKAAEPEGLDFVFDPISYKYYGVLATRQTAGYYKLVF